MADLFIIAAGLGSRMGGDLPKALVPINQDIPCLTTTLQQAHGKFDNIFVVTNKLCQTPWVKYFTSLKASDPHLIKNVKNIPISSGLGDGHAVGRALIETKNLSDNGDIVVMWGDVFVPNAELFDELLATPLTQSGLIPVVREDNPYVTLLTDERMNCMAADFSKYGESHPTGFHDQSVFRFTRWEIARALNHLDVVLWKNGRYITPGGELSLLHTFHYLYNYKYPLQVYETRYPTMSFNTPEEVKTIQMEINAQWKNQS